MKKKVAVAVVETRSGTRLIEFSCIDCQQESFDFDEPIVSHQFVLFTVSGIKNVRVALFLCGSITLEVLFFYEENPP